MARTPAAEKAAPKKAPKTTGAVNSYDEELAAFAAQYADMEQNSTGSLQFISTKGGRLSFNGGEVPDGRMNVIVLDHRMENQMYDREFDADNPASPVCFAFGTNPEDMRPHENSSEPQSEACAGCPMNEFGSAERGKGKACKNIRRLAIIPEGELDNVEDAAVAYLKVPVMSVKNWAGYVQQLGNIMKVPPFAVITEVSIVSDPKSQFRLEFKLVEQITSKPTVKLIMAKRESIQQELETSYQMFEAAEEPVQQKRNRPAPARKPARDLPAPPARKPAPAVKGRTVAPPAPAAKAKRKF